jgi:hypothetical protein
LSQKPPNFVRFTQHRQSVLLLSLYGTINQLKELNNTNMETTNIYQDRPKASLNKSLLTGRIISGLIVLFMLFDSIGKIIKEIHSIQGSIALGWPEHLVQPIGIVLLISTILYMIPRSAFIGAILLTAYLGGAIAIMVRVGQPLYFALVFGILVWVGLFLRNQKLRTLIQ